MPITTKSSCWNSTPVYVVSLFARAFYLKHNNFFHTMKLSQLDCCGCKGGRRGNPRGLTWPSKLGGLIFPIYLKSFYVFLDHLGQNDESSSVGKIVHDMKERKQVW